MKLQYLVPLAFCTMAAVAAATRATEPNESFGAATVLAPGVLSVSDSLTPGVLVRPDTLLGIRNGAGEITLTDDDGSVFGDGRASGLAGVPTNDGDIAFAVTGKGDVAFDGSHSEIGLYDIVIDVFDSGGTPISTFSTDLMTLDSGAVDEFAFPGMPNWIGGTYDVNIDNGLADPAGGDVDFFTFTGLNPGVVFTAQTSHPTSGLNTFLYEYNAEGDVVAIDDQSGAGAFSLLQGFVPDNGKLTFGVTGFGDTFLEGKHTQDGDYNLTVDLRLAADFNASGQVNRTDLNLWQASFGKDAGADADLDGDSDGADFLTWQRQFTDKLTPPAIAAVPEPAAAGLGLLGLTLLAVGRPRR